MASSDGGDPDRSGRDDALQRYFERATPEERERLARALADRGARSDLDAPPLGRRTVLLSRVASLLPVVLYAIPDTSPFSDAGTRWLAHAIVGALIGLLLTWFPNRLPLLGAAMARIDATRDFRRLATPEVACLMGWFLLLFPLAIHWIAG